jgi:hypothetical protein
MRGNHAGKIRCPGTSGWPCPILWATEGLQGISTRSKRAARKLDLLAFVVPDAGPVDPDAPVSQRHRARGRPRSARNALGISLPERTAQPLAVLLHHRIQNLTTRIDAQFEKPKRFTWLFTTFDLDQIFQAREFRVI